VIEWRCSFDGVVIDDAPCLERLLFDSTGDPRPIKIVHAPRLQMLGFLDLQLHTLQIGGILIKVVTAPCNFWVRVHLSFIT
jgi:hypothetical protein